LKKSEKSPFLSRKKRLINKKTEKKAPKAESKTNRKRHFLTFLKIFFGEAKKQKKIPPLKKVRQRRLFKKNAFGEKVRF